MMLLAGICCAGSTLCVATDLKAWAPATFGLPSLKPPTAHVPELERPVQG